MDVDLRGWASEAMQEVPIFKMVANELPTIARIAKAPLGRHHMFRTMLKLAEGTRMTELMETMKPLTQRTIENDLAYLRRAGVLRSQEDGGEVGSSTSRAQGRETFNDLFACESARSCHE